MRLTCATMATTGVMWTAFTSEKASGSCPFLAPANRRRDCRNMKPLVVPKVEHITNMGISLAATPSVRSANVCKWKRDEYVWDGVHMVTAIQKAQLLLLPNTKATALEATISAGLSRTR